MMAYKKYSQYGSLLIPKRPFEEIHKKAIVKSVVPTEKSIIIEYTSKDGKNNGRMELYDRRYPDKNAIPISN